jgi:hypothetical protein
MDIFILLALIAFGAGAVLAAVQRSWALALVAAGLFLVTFAKAGLG